MSTILLLLIIALAVAVGCYVGQKHLLEINKANKRASFTRDYFTGLNYLINEQPDKAVDVFTKLVQVDSETVETHLMLGSLFRRRGEVGRAIRIHQNLIARPQLSKQQRITALVALGKDYLHAGLIDRAERVFLEITSLGEQPTVSLHYLLDIYQQQKNWQSAIKVAHQLNTLTNEHLHVPIAHYYCELAQNYLQHHDSEEAKKMLKQALKTDAQCVRANLLSGEIELQQERYKNAVQVYEQIYEQDSEYFAEALPGLIKAYQALHNEKELAAYIEQRLNLLHDTAFILYLTAYYQTIQSDAQTIAFLTKYLQQHPSLSGLQYLIQLQLKNSASPMTQKDLVILQELVKNLLNHRSRYRCIQCGFRSNQLLWLCPGCKTWSHIKPVQDSSYQQN